MKHVPILIVFAVLLAACSSTGEHASRTASPSSAVTATSRPQPPRAGRIAFVLGNQATLLYTAAPDGSDAHALTDFGAEDPDWSPDGSMIAFNSERAGHSHVFVINADGTGLRQITSGDGYEGHPGWSPDGEYLAVDRAGPSGEHQGIHIVSVADGTMARITTNPYGGEEADAGPQYSRDGTRIVFIRTRDGLSAVWVVNGDGSDPHQITPWKMKAGHPWWSPDGSRIVFYDGVDSVSYGAGDSHILVINADGTGLQQLTHGENVADFHPS